MVEFIVNNLSTIIVGTLIFTLVTLVVLKLIKDKKNHKSSCGGGCAGCPSKGMCHSK
ncbi:MAG: FeoB-associated Cys-rich membrane protein [Oscillospiraceae bacterium]